jgi:hypothetical protein
MRCGPRRWTSPANLIFTPRVTSLVPSVSVIIPALNAEDSVGACIESVLAQDLPPGELELILVDNGSRDRTLEKARRYPIQVVEEPRRGRSRARNLGARVARGEYLGFVDVDCEAPKNWLSASLSLMDRPWIGGVQARVQKPGFAPTSPRFTQAHYYRPFLDTCAMVTLRSAYRHAHGFDEELRRTVDMDYSFRLLSCGYAFGWVPEVVMIKHHDLNPRQIVRRGWDGGKSLSELSRKWQALTPEPATQLWRDRLLSWGRTLLGDARHPLSSRGRNALEGTCKVVAAAITDLRAAPVHVERYEVVTPVARVLGSRASLVIERQGGLVYDAAARQVHELNAARRHALTGLIDALPEEQLMVRVQQEAGVDHAAARSALDAVRALSRQLLQAANAP